MTTHSNGKPITIEFGEEYVVTDPGASMWKVGTVLVFLSDAGGTWQFPNGAKGTFTRNNEVPLWLAHFTYTMVRKPHLTMEEMYKELM